VALARLYGVVAIFHRRVMQSVTNGDFEIEAKFDSALAQRFQIRGCW